MILSFIVCILLASAVFADVYMHNPRGSNDRNCERNSARNNGNRLFDSQNNDQGGYACPRAVGGPEVTTETMYYFEGSKLQIEYTNQHGCNNPNVDCEIILQYMCSPEPYGQNITDWTDPWFYVVNPHLRDGTPVDGNDAATNTMQTNEEDRLDRGYHETYPYYLACQTRNRNNGLWVADQNLQTQATSTRQNNNADRHGWECAEERDYYPYWHPSPWKDIAVLNNGPKSCSYYQQNSQNQNDKYWCLTSSGTPATENNFAACQQAGNTWSKVPSWNIPNLECQMPDWSRDNHLGNTLTGSHANYVWTIPEVEGKDSWSHCILRLRYNISNANVDWDLDWTFNDANSPVLQDPYITLMGKDTLNTKHAINLSLALNTNQYGRTFQDRSYVFEIRKKDGNAPVGTIWNLNVRGKRGNIVDVYPSVEYDFVPQFLDVNVGDYVHFQWIGGDYNPNETPNAAEGGPQDPANPGNYRADRSNIIPVMSNHEIINPNLMTDKWFGVFTSEQMVSAAYINQDMTKCKDLKYLQLKYGNNNNNAIKQDSENCMILNVAATPYFDLAGGPVKMTKTGQYLYMSSRNNNFSNRNQRGSITVHAQMSTSEQAAIGVGAAVGAAGLAGGGFMMYKKKFAS